MGLNINSSNLNANATLKSKNANSFADDSGSKTSNLSSLGSKDNVISDKLKKINDSGNNPFGANSNVDANSPANGVIAKSFLTSMNKLDANNNGFISSRELVNKMQDPNITGREAALVGTLIKNQGKIQNLSNDNSLLETDGISKKDILALDQLPNDNKLKNEVDSQYYYDLSKINNAHAKFNNIFDDQGKMKLSPKVSDINFQDLKQGSTGDCYFLAALSSLAQHSPQKIIDMVKDNKDGTFTVKFSDKSVTVKAPTDTELGLYAEGKAWVPVIEKAYSVYRNETIFLPKENPYDKSGGGSMITGRGIKDLTGSNFDTDLLMTTSTNTTRTKLKSAVANNKMMTASIAKNPFGKNSLGLPDGHVYSIVGYDEKTDKVKIRNPWGQTEAQDKSGSARDGNDDGICELSMQEFNKTFSAIAYQN